MAEMWDVEFEVIATAYRMIEADSEEEALRIAEEQGVELENISEIESSTPKRVEIFLKQSATPS